MNLLCIWNLFPGKLSITFSGNRGYGYFMTHIADTAYRVGDDQADYIRTGFLIGMGRVGSIACMAIAKIPLEGDDIMVAARGIDKIDFEGAGILFPFKSGIAI